MWARTRNPSNGTADGGQPSDPSNKAEGHLHSRSPACSINRTEFGAQQTKPSTRGCVAPPSQPTKVKSFLRDLVVLRGGLLAFRSATQNSSGVTLALRSLHLLLEVLAQGLPCQLGAVHVAPFSEIIDRRNQTLVKPEPDVNRRLPCCYRPLTHACNIRGFSRWTRGPKLHFCS